MENHQESIGRKRMKGCELCPGTARMFCESDQASLCFECDGKVHGANFLVARHSRVLLCRSCQSPTPWKAAGPRLCPTVSVCDLCVSAGGRSKKNNDDDYEGESAARERVAEEEDGDNDDDHQEEDVDDEEMEGDDDDDDDEMESDDDDEEEEEEEGEEQVVPWSTEPLPPVASSSSSEEESTVGQRFNGNNYYNSNNNNGFLKRNRWGNVDLPSSSCNQDQMPCSSSSRPSYVPSPSRTALSSHPAAQTVAGDDEATSDSFRPSKDRKKSDLVRFGSHQLPAISFCSGRPPI